MVAGAPEDDSLEGLARADVPSELHPNVSYRLGNRLGEGGMSVAFYAMRMAPGSKTPVVVKILRPSFVRSSGDTANLIVLKEAVALGRLNEQAAPTPFVVRLIDVGAIRVAHRNRSRRPATPQDGSGGRLRRSPRVSILVPPPRSR